VNDHLRDRIQRKLETLSDERGYQILDYVDFLESRYAERAPAPSSVFQRFADAVEDRLRAGQVSASAVAETMGLMNRAMGVLSGVAAAGKSVANDIVGAAAAATRTPPRPADAGAPAGTPTGASAGGATSAPATGSGGGAATTPPSTQGQGMDQ
jgi:hypothetical protein